MPGIMQLRKNFRIGSEEGYDVSGREYAGSSSSQGRQDAESQYGGGYNVDYRSGDNRSDRGQVYGAGNAPITQIDLLETFKPQDLSALFNRRTVADFISPIKKPYQTVATIKNPSVFTDITKDVLNPDDNEQVDSLTGEKDEGAFDNIKEFLSNTLIGRGIGYLKDQYDKQKQKDLFANTMDPGIPKDRIADFINRGGNDNQGIASLPYMYPIIQPQKEIVEEPEEISFYDILRQNLGLV